MKWLHDVRARTFIGALVLALAEGLVAVGCGTGNSETVTSDGSLWILRFSTGEGDFGNDLAADDAGNLYVVGGTWGSLPGQANLGKSDAFVRKYDSDGNEVWTRQFGSGGGDMARQVGLDRTGNVYVVGETAAKFLTWVSKYDSDGNELWKHEFRSGNQHPASAFISGTTLVRSLALDSLGNLCLVSRSLVRKYDPDGNELWSHSFGQPRVSTVMIDESDGVYVVGSTWFKGSDTAWVRKYDADGTELWVQQLDTPSEVNATTLSKNNVFVSSTLENGSGDIHVVSYEYVVAVDGSVVRLRVHVTKYNSSWDRLSTLQFTPTEAQAVAIDEADNLYVKGVCSPLLKVIIP